MHKAVLTAAAVAALSASAMAQGNMSGPSETRQEDMQSQSLPVPGSSGASEITGQALQDKASEQQAPDPSAQSTGDSEQDR